MRILVVDDKEGNRKSAEKTLDGHELTIVGSCEEAMKLMQVPPEFRRGELAPAIPFDAVLTDMMMPTGKNRTLAPQYCRPDELVPYGFVIALRAAMRGAKFVAMITDTNHHAGAMSAVLDSIDDTYYHSFPGETKTPENPPNFNINGARAMFVHAPLMENEAGEFVKDWGKVFAGLVSGVE